MKKSPHTGGPWNCEGFNRYSTPRRFDIHNLKAEIPPADFYRRYLPDMPLTKKAGWVDGGLCPFHSDTHKGNFRVNLDTGAFRCFACNAKGGDVFAFTMLREGLGFRDALQRLAEAWGVA